MLVMTLSDPPTGQVWKSYYFAGSQLVAMRVQGDPVAQNNGLFFLHADHLGSTSLATDASGAVVPNSRQSYDAWGNVRVRGDLKTDISYTAQREDRSINLMFYRARYYSPSEVLLSTPQTPQPNRRASITLF